ncbi:MAG: hypothetical protein ABSG43_21485 [Solirubrobacteraceae bacterium]|jgi:hypothetical protein
MSGSCRCKRCRGGGAGRLRGARKRRWLSIALLAVGAEIAILWSRGYGVSGNVVVRCRQGHLFSTIWIPAASVKSLRLGWWRVQRCPVGKHWSLVTPVNKADLSEEQRRSAAEHADIRIP